MNIVLANADYRSHMTDEGWQLQQGLAHAGWRLVGRGFDPDEVDVQKILDQIEPPEACFIQDARDWDKTHPGCFDPAVSFEHIELLHDQPFPKIVVVKDAGSVVEYQQEFAERVGASMAVHYYHDRSILPLSPWLDALTRLRTYHSVDASQCIRHYAFGARPKKAMISGAMHPNVYPIRWQFYEAACSGRSVVDLLPHPGYGNQGRQVDFYLKTLSQYRVHVATASKYGFALRKIIESVAMGCTPVTNLPAFDVLPEIDGALTRIPHRAQYNDICGLIAAAERAWNPEERLHWATRAWAFYDWRAMGTRLAARIAEAQRRMERADDGALGRDDPADGLLSRGAVSHLGAAAAVTQ
jgi:hypothetical protein